MFSRSVALLCLFVCISVCLLLFGNITQNVMSGLQQNVIDGFWVVNGKSDYILVVIWITMMLTVHLEIRTLLNRFDGDDSNRFDGGSMTATRFDGDDSSRFDGGSMTATRFDE